MGAVLLACALLSQFVSRCDDVGEHADTATRRTADIVEKFGAGDHEATSRPSALQDPVAGLVAITPATVATIARNLPANPHVPENPVTAAEHASARADPLPTVAADADPTVMPGSGEDRLADSARPTGTSVVEVAEVEPAPYVDHYLTDDATAGDYGLQASRNARIGRRLLEAELIYYDSNDAFFGGATEKGLLTRWRQETLNWGEFDAQLIFSDIESDFFGRQYRSDELFFTFRQQNAPLENGWLMNNVAGHQRTLIDPFLHSGYRIRLPTSLFLGVSMGVTTDTSTGQWYMGKTGDNLGIAVPQFHENGGEILGGSWRRPFGGNFMLGAEVVDVKGHDLVRDHTSLLAAGSYSTSDGAGRYDLHLLTDDDTNFGLWADARSVMWSDTVLRFGGFFLEPDLAWMDRPIVNDQYGAYLRADKRTYLYNYSLGYDYTQAGIGEDSFFDARHQSIYANGNYRFTRKLSIGANGNLLLRDFQSTTADSQVAWRVSNFVNYRFRTGMGRLELYASQLNSDFDLNNNDVLGARVSYDWDMPQGYRLTTEALAEEQRRLGLDNSNQRLTVLFRQSIADNFSWGLNTSYYRDVNEALNTSTGIGVNADARWQFLRDWYVSATLMRNETSIDPSAANLVGGETELQSDAVWLRIGYANASGQPHRRYGRNTSGAGAGRIRGEVFYDENRDFIRQPGERPAVGVVVVIDGRYEARTDAQGRYEFDPVYPGPHHVTLITEDLPLPWGLDDEAPQAVDVMVRQTSEVDFALVDLNVL